MVLVKRNLDLMFFFLEIQCDKLCGEVHIDRILIHLVTLKACPMENRQIFRQFDAWQ